jgi:hypothetical protein
MRRRILVRRYARTFAKMKTSNEKWLAGVLFFPMIPLVLFSAFCAITEDNLLPGLLAIGMVLLEICYGMLAIGAIVLAAFGYFRLAILTAAPAFVFSILDTVILVYMFYFAPDAKPEALHTNGDFMLSWIFYSGIPLALSIFAGLLALICNREGKKDAQ